MTVYKISNIVVAENTDIVFSDTDFAFVRNYMFSFEEEVKYVIYTYLGVGVTPKSYGVEKLSRLSDNKYHTLVWALQNKVANLMSTDTLYICGIDKRANDVILSATIECKMLHNNRLMYFLTFREDVNYIFATPNINEIVDSFFDFVADFFTEDTLDNIDYFA